jgi:hypothetical protein
MPRKLVWCVLWTHLFVLAGCNVFGPQVVDHAFSFDLGYDDQDAVVLNYRYGNTKLPISPTKEQIEAGQTFYYQSVQGPMLRPDFLYVKWRIKSTGQVYEDTVDLRHRLPAGLKHHRVTFLIRGPQLYIYLIPPNTEKRPPGAPSNGPHMYDYLNTVTIYPDQPKP